MVCWTYCYALRKGSFAMYLEPWHADVMDFLELRKIPGSSCGFSYYGFRVLGSGGLEFIGFNEVCSQGLLCRADL